MRRPVPSDRLSPGRAATPWRHAAGLLAAAVLAVSPLSAQQAAPGNAAPVQDAGAAVSPAPAAAAPAKPAPATAGTVSPAAPRGAASPLPAWFQPPRPVPDAMAIEDPLLSREEIDREWNELNRQRIGTVIREGQLTPERQALLTRWAQLRLREMTAVEDWTKVPDLARQTTQELRNAGFLQKNENRQREFRDYLNGEVAKAAAEVMDNNFYVRVQAALILGQLNSREESGAGGGKRPEIGYAKALGPLLDVIADADQPPGVKVVAARGVGRLAETADVVDAELKFRAADVLTTELRRADTHYWYQMRLAEALGRLKLEYDRNRRPIVVAALSDVIVDEKRHCLARTAAAKALGRTPIPAEVDQKDLAARLVRLGEQLALSYNASPSRAHWKECFLNLYLTFRPGPGEDLAKTPSALAAKKTQTGPMDDAYKRIFPLAKHVLAQPVGPAAQPIATDLIKQLNDYLAANRP